MAGILNLLKRLKRDRRGVAAVEFAFIAPVMILFYFGLAELCQATLAERKTIRTASAVGDLVAQESAVNTALITDFFEIGDILMAPFPVTGVKMCVMSVSTNASGTRSVDWSRTRNSATCPAASTVPAALLGNNESIIISQVTYPYISAMNQVVKTNPTFVKTQYLRPRKSSKVTCSNC